MKVQSRKSGCAGVTKLEVVVILAVIVVLCSFIAIWLAKPKRKFAEINCESKLERIGIAFTTFANDHSGVYPMQLSETNGGTLEYVNIAQEMHRHFQVLSNSMQVPEPLVCPKDTRSPAVDWRHLTNSNISYFVGVDARSAIPGAILSGDRNLTTNENLVISLQSGLKWNPAMGLHGNVGHVLFADGHVERLDSTGLSSATQQTGNGTNRIAIP